VIMPELPGSIFSRSFGAEAERYARFRPGYPADAIDLALANIEQPQRILDLGAGTGKLTQSLIGRAPQVLAVEPDAEMLAMLARQVPEAQPLPGSAEQIPLPDGSVEAILVGQAFHWFARPAADHEMARVLRPGGVAALIWNYPDHEVEWVPKLYESTKERTTPWSQGFENLDTELFTEATLDHTSWDYELPGADGLLAMVHTWSWVITRSAAEQRAIDDRFRILVSQYAELQGPVVRLPQRTRIVRQYKR
jgi:SAM-dependent methyltransferase